MQIIYYACIYENGILNATAIFQCHYFTLLYEVSYTLEMIFILLYRLRIVNTLILQKLHSCHVTLLECNDLALQFLHYHLAWLFCQQHAFKTHESIFFLTVVHILAYPWPLQTPLFFIFVYSWRATIFSILAPLSFLIGSIRSDNAKIVLNIVVGFPINLLPDTSTLPDFSRNSK